MKRILLIANTYYQLIISIQMRLTIFKNNEVILLLSDHSKNAENICAKLNTTGIFQQTCFIKTKGIVNNRKRSEKFCDFLDISFRNRNRYSFILQNICDLSFDELICYNYGIDIIGLYSILSMYNKNIKVSLFEEGILSYGVYFEDNYRRKLIKSVRRLLGKKDISSAFYKFYCFYPQLYEGSLETVTVPSISANSDCADILRKVFNINADKLYYPQKYFYFSSVYDFECGDPIGEFELILKIADIVGRENLIIKSHPRDIRSIFTDNGFLVDENSSIPWEVIQLSGDFSDKVFMTATSGSVLAGSFMTDKPTKTFYMYKLCDISKNYGAQGTANDIYNLLQSESVKSVLNKVKIIDSLEEIVK